MTRMYVLRHGATLPNLEKPPRLQGRGLDEPLAPLGIAQAERAAAVLAQEPLQAIFSSPLRRARQTAEIIAQRHVVPVQFLEGLQEGDVGRWEGRRWDEIRQNEPEAYRQFMADPATFGYPGGESFADVAHRVVPVFNDILQRHEGASVLVVSHQIVCRVYLAGLLGLTPAQARRVKLENCGISTIQLEEGKPFVWTLNSTWHL